MRLSITALLAAGLVGNLLATDVSFKIDDVKNLSVLSGISEEDAGQSIKELIIPQVDKIGEKAFQNREDIEFVKFADHSLCHTIEKMAFCGCSSLKSFKFGTGGNGVENIEDRAFFGCSELNEIDFPYTLKKIGSNAFNGCSALKSIDLSGQITEVGDFAFMLCGKLEVVKLGHNLVRIGNSAFFGCENLVFNDLNVDEIGISAFENCTKLKQINLTSVRTIGETAFRGCTAIKSVIIPDTTAFIGENAFANCTALETISINIKAFYSAIKNNAFAGCNNIKQINIHLDNENKITVKNLPNSWDDFMKKVTKKQQKLKIIEYTKDLNIEKKSNTTEIQQC